MSINKLKNKKIAILGLGIENYALVNFLLYKKINCEITVCDKRSKKELGDRYKKFVKTQNFASIQWKLGKNYDKGLGKYDIIFRSPGYPLFSSALRRIKSPQPPLSRGSKSPSAPFIKGGTIVSSPMKLFFDLCPSRNIIGVTGTKGKGTTASLIYVILKQSFKSATTNGAHANKLKRNVWLGGNIGVAPFEFINKIKKNDWVILELSSFQLEDMEANPKIAVITNFYKEHLSAADPNNPNYHLSLKEYRKAKMNIIKWQRRGDYAVVNSRLKKQTPKLKSKIIYFDKSELPLKLVGEHNKENIAAAVEVAKIVRIKKAVIEKTVKNFKGLEHRLELVKIVQGVKYYNDSFSTIPESTIIALNSFNTPIILIVGGAEKKSDFKKLAGVIKKRVVYVILLNGKATPRLKKEIVKAGFFGKNIKLVYNIREAVKAARANSIKGEIVLLSPACASFGMFSNYKERGDLFKKEVKRLV